ncbi:MAG: hypothetical protein U9O82_00295, partial [Thermodesulfobacteriota bacterium]|nr:hypothetical protein [Thermodesulfobacteriota bacterium]
RVMRIYEIAWSPSQKGDTDKQVCPCHPSPIASPKSVIIRIKNISNRSQALHLNVISPAHILLI